jgi:23S rRNA pseudouridine1911/1915/1917 synthase
MKRLDKEQDLNILFCDNHILVVDKPGGLLTQPNNSKQSNLEDLSKEWVKKKYNKKGNIFLHCIHRLDKPVSGIVLFARTSKALSRLNEQSRSQKIKRWYLAEVEGILKEKSGVLENYLVHGSHKAHVFDKKTEKSKLAILKYKVLKTKKDSTVVEIELQTGRYHQIRAQFSYIRHPIVGDQKYGSKNELKCIKLCHHKMEFSHPVSKENMSFIKNVSCL